MNQFETEKPRAAVRHVIWT